MFRVYYALECPQTLGRPRALLVPRALRVARSTAALLVGTLRLKPVPCRSPHGKPASKPAKEADRRPIVLVPKGYETKLNMFNAKVRPQRPPGTVRSGAAV